MDLLHESFVYPASWCIPLLPPTPSTSRPVNLAQTSNSEDLTFLREQIITTEVNTARAYNFNVKESRKSRLAAGAGAPPAAAGAGGK